MGMFRKFLDETSDPSELAGERRKKEADLRRGIANLKAQINSRGMTDASMSNSLTAAKNALKAAEDELANLLKQK
jgi:hypothetical protein